jgi:hypothetical protein
MCCRSRSAPYHGPLRKVPTNESALPQRPPRVAELCTFTIVSAAFRARRFSCTCHYSAISSEQGLWRLSRRLSRSLRKPAVCGGQHRACFSALVLLREQARQAHRRTQFPRLAPGSRAIDMASRRASSISMALRPATVGRGETKEDGRNVICVSLGRRRDRP